MLLHLRGLWSFLKLKPILLYFPLVASASLINLAVNDANTVVAGGISVSLFSACDPSGCEAGAIKTMCVWCFEAPQREINWVSHHTSDISNGASDAPGPMWCILRIMMDNWSQKKGMEFKKWRKNMWCR